MTVAVLLLTVLFGFGCVLAAMAIVYAIGDQIAAAREDES